jgi:penicillin amidase
MNRRRSLVVLEGVDGRVEIARGSAGEAEIDASTLADAIFALGYVHARDRGLQMLLVRILARGEASEILSSDDEMLELDRFFRSFNLSADSTYEESRLSDHAREHVIAYSRGVNAYFASNSIPWELRLVGVPKRAPLWGFSDIYLTGKIIGYVGLAQMQADFERFLIQSVQNGVPIGALEELYPGKLAYLDVDLIREVHLIDPIVPHHLKWNAESIPPAVSSNNWAVAAWRSATGYPLFASDPHMELSRLPAIWYEAALRWKSDGRERYAIGATMPGTPAMVFGRNADLAWGVTYANMDCVDSWIEDCRDGTYLRGDDRIPFRVRHERIRRKRKAEVDFVFYENDHGVLAGDPFVPGRYLATRWSAAEHTGASTLDGFARLYETDRVDRASDIVSHINNSSWNWVLADRSGNIGYKMSGRMPIRRPGASGLVPLAGCDPRNDWTGFVDPADLPGEFNPARGFIATANQNLNHLGAAKPINICVAPYRYERIDRELSADKMFSLDDMKALQCDIKSIQAERFMRVLRPILERIKADENVKILLDWDFRYDADSRGATLFERFYRALIEEFFSGSEPTKHAGPIGGVALAHLLDETSCFSEYYGEIDDVMLAERSEWLGVRDRDEVFRIAFERARVERVEPYRSTRMFLMKHLLLGGKLPVRLGFDRGPFVLEGGRATVRQGQIVKTRGRRFAMGPSYRIVADLGLDEIDTALPGGPSDRAFGKWYASGIAAWLEGKYQKIKGFRGVDRKDRSES